MMEKETDRIRVVVDEDLWDLIPNYLANRRRDVEAIGEALAAGDFEKIRGIGHKMKGSGGGYGFDEITSIGRGMEEAAKAGDGIAIRRELKRLDDYLGKVEVVKG
ncbi:MAG TPA: Hpt domain-containing protein [Syntrophales bacterium]|nr:Hpt domain-containing protein [Syntrophales bacterium]HOM06139.1 Hpt domain-containing protein [Syntrophales bacterium]HON98997.1 Hpt domain-containing protein [Syntrophales bacterium]HRS86094.1 Hpt domain-containing protein [Syntrophales bacterium]